MDGNQPTKTPVFDRHIDEILKTLKPHQSKCKQCDEVFAIFKEDIDFYKIFQVPPPKFCPACRSRRRAAFYPRLYDFFRKPCSAPGHSEQVISIYPPESPIKIYDLDFWFSDFWDPIEFQKDLTPENFLKQFQELAFETPHPAGIRGTRLTDCNYTIGGLDSKDCYYTTTAASSENICYSFMLLHSKHCLDCSDSEELELCYEIVDSKRCYNCSFLQDCTNCIDSDFLFDCHNCSSCFACCNLRNRQYYFFNQPCTKDDYFKRRKDVFLGNCQALKRTKKEFEEKVLKIALRRNLYTKNTINSLGHKIENCQDCYFVFSGYGQENQHLRYCEEFQGAKDLMDTCGTSYDSYIYDTAAAIRCSGVRFSFWITNSSDIEYSMFCDNCHHCFGCFGLKNKEHCILNKQYSREDYWRLVDEIKTNLAKQNQYGEFFEPRVFKFYPYNNTMAFLSFPKTKEEAEKEGYLWAERERWSRETKGSDPNVLFAPDGLPDDIREVKDDIMNKAIVCEISKRPFKLVKRELDFYRQKGLPLPSKHPYQRLIDRSQKQASRYSLYAFVCPKCQKQTHTIYPPEAQKEYNICCEACYLKEVV
ncbi:MAG: hypothetical protein PHN39_02770 [Candidatus Pacebacteria bacterium]|nr:hypothetical protein [Candidatus Paceibacterota bacterium]